MAKRRGKRKRHTWTSDEISFLKQIYRNMSTEDVAWELGRSPASVSAKAFILRLRKSKPYLRSIDKA